MFSGTALITLPEFSKNEIDLFFRDARTAVFDEKNNFFLRKYVTAECDVAECGKFKRIIEKIFQDLLNPGKVRLKQNIYGDGRHEHIKINH